DVHVRCSLRIILHGRDRGVVRNLIGVRLQQEKRGGANAVLREGKVAAGIRGGVSDELHPLPWLRGEQKNFLVGHRTSSGFVQDSPFTASLGGQQSGREMPEAKTHARQ